jgi:hypothetical protein
MYMKLLEIIIVDFDLTDQLLISFCIRQILEKIWEYHETELQLFVDFKKAYVSVRKYYHRAWSTQLR